MVKQKQTKTKIIKRKTIIFNDFSIVTNSSKEFLKELDKLCNKYRDKNDDVYYTYEFEEELK